MLKRHVANCIHAITVILRIYATLFILLYLLLIMYTYMHKNTLGLDQNPLACSDSRYIKLHTLNFK